MKKRINELYEIINNAETELKSIRSECLHEHYSAGNYGWGPGRICHGMICDECGEFLGEYKTFPNWTERLVSYIECVYGTTIKDSKDIIRIDKFYNKTNSLYENITQKGLSERLDIIRFPDKYNTFGDKLISEEEFYSSIKQYTE